MTTLTPSLPPPARDWPEQGLWTYADWERLPDDGYRYEVIQGVLHMSPPPSILHQSASNRLATLITNHADDRKLGWVFTAPVGVALPTEPVPLQPDILFVSAARQAIIGKQYIDGAPDLIVEILSPSNWTFDRKEKFQVYQAAGVPEYWIIDYRARTIEIFVLEEGEYALVSKVGLGEMAVSQRMADFQVAVAEVFREV